MATKKRRLSRRSSKAIEKGHAIKKTSATKASRKKTSGKKTSAKKTTTKKVNAKKRALQRKRATKTVAKKSSRRTSVGRRMLAAEVAAQGNFRALCRNGDFQGEPTTLPQAQDEAIQHSARTGHFVDVIQTQEG